MLAQDADDKVKMIVASESNMSKVWHMAATGLGPKDHNSPWYAPISKFTGQEE